VLDILSNLKGVDIFYMQEDFALKKNYTLKLLARRSLDYSLECELNMSASYIQRTLI